MSFTPPQPGLPASFLTAVLACTFDATANALRDATGAQRFPVLVRAASGCGAVDWGVDGAASTCPRALLSHATYEILTLGALQTDGTILFRGARYAVNATGPSLLCSAVAA